MVEYVHKPPCCTVFAPVRRDNRIGYIVCARVYTIRVPYTLSKNAPSPFVRVPLYRVAHTTTKARLNSEGWFSGDVTPGFFVVSFSAILFMCVCVCVV